MSYDALRHFADSYGLLFLTLIFLFIVAWTFRRSARDHHDRAATSIFDEGERRDG
jgi:cytochrome c oxidase cbb3-type subunit 4